MKIAVEVTETLTRTVIVEADDYNDAEEKINQAYYSGALFLDQENSQIDVSCKDDTETYVNIFGKEEFEKNGT